MLHFLPEIFCGWNWPLLTRPSDILRKFIQFGRYCPPFSFKLSGKWMLWKFYMLCMLLNRLVAVYLVLGLIFPISVQRVLDGEKGEKIKRSNNFRRKDESTCQSKREQCFQFHLLRRTLVIPDAEKYPFCRSIKHITRIKVMTVQENALPYISTAVTANGMGNLIFKIKWANPSAK